MFEGTQLKFFAVDGLLYQEIDPSADPERLEDDSVPDIMGRSMTSNFYFYKVPHLKSL